LQLFWGDGILIRQLALYVGVPLSGHCRSLQIIALFIDEASHY